MAHEVVVHAGDSVPKMLLVFRTAIHVAVAWTEKASVPWLCVITGNDRSGAVVIDVHAIVVIQPCLWLSRALVSDAMGIETSSLSLAMFRMLNLYRSCIVTHHALGRDGQVLGFK